MSVKYARYLEIRRVVWFFVDSGVKISLYKLWRSFSFRKYPCLNVSFVPALYIRLWMCLSCNNYKEKALGVLTKIMAVLSPGDVLGKPQIWRWLISLSWHSISNCLAFPLHYTHFKNKDIIIYHSSRDKIWQRYMIHET